MVFRGIYYEKYILPGPACWQRLACFNVLFFYFMRFSFLMGTNASQSFLPEFYNAVYSYYVPEPAGLLPLSHSASRGIKISGTHDSVSVPQKSLLLECSGSYTVRSLPDFGAAPGFPDGIGETSWKHTALSPFPPGTFCCGFPECSLFYTGIRYIPCRHI